VNDPADIERAEQVVAEHLIRMAHKDNLTVQWVRSDTVAEAQEVTK
jgi:hypothetical protein